MKGLPECLWLFFVSYALEFMVLLIWSRCIAKLVSRIKSRFWWCFIGLLFLEWEGEWFSNCWLVVGVFSSKSLFEVGSENMWWVCYDGTTFKLLKVVRFIICLCLVAFLVTEIDWGLNWLCVLREFSLLFSSVWIELGLNDSLRLKLGELSAVSATISFFCLDCLRE